MPKTAFIVAAVGLLSGCLANMPVRLDTPSGQPEVTIAAEKKRVIAALTNRMLDKGWQVKSADEHRVVFKRVDDSIGGMAMFGTNFNGFPEARAEYSLVDSEGGVRVVCNLKMVSNPGSGFEQETEMRGRPAMEAAQEGLLEVQRSLTVASAPK